ncbi:MAG: hypothetical protein ACE15E_20585 [Acidobacteriota bacterium]
MAQLNLSPPRAVVVHCSDSRFQAAFHDFIENCLHLGPGEYTPLIVPGSATALGSLVQMQLPKNFKILTEQLSLIFANHRGQSVEVAIIGHEDCRGQRFLAQKVAKFVPIPPNLTHRSEWLLAERIIREIARLFVPSCSIRFFQACIGTGDCVFFKDALTGERVWPR